MASNQEDSSSPESLKNDLKKLSFDGGLRLKKEPVKTKPAQPAAHSVKIQRIKDHKAAGKLRFGPNEETYEYTSEDLVDLGEIGRGNFGSVSKMLHRQSQTKMAVKRIHSTVDEKEQKQLLMDLEVVMNSSECPYIVKFYGALFTEGDAWICMELMETSLDILYKLVYGKLGQAIPEDILGVIALAVVKALDYLKSNLKIIHRDVKPSNILLDLSGNIKLCDFGISGHLVDSIAKTRDAGCKPYMAPERIDPDSLKNGYDVRSDVWSFGLTMIELATGKFPYPKWTSVFDQLTAVVMGDPPQLSNDNPSKRLFSPEFIDFVNTCVTKDVSKRPKYRRLLEFPFLQRYEQDKVQVDVGSWVKQILNDRPPEIYESHF
ncbi:dual specificity mitogen-activated protein kinase kinase 4-like [Dendronephthya gigantea]|uniref:dual specificity mitogen-activated protein kinase kinase 4-like n=1 Tax=Dendronephthya gigantea TaxID=151771 RepID=UPI00106A4AC9|nr:dual specificity mitogen-activated protein kinase kinase 4-like [Dendronephthya gigantea]